MNRVQILEAARALIDTPEKWIQGGNFGIREGNELIVLGALIEDGNCYCSYGALLKVLYEPLSEYTVHGRINRAQALLIKEFGLNHAIFNGIINFNDAPGRKHSEVLEYFDKLIERERKELANSRSK